MLKSLNPCTILRVQSWDVQAAAPKQIEQILEIVWHNVVGTVDMGRAEVLCTGPTDWLILATSPDAASLLKTLTEGFRGSPYRVTDVSVALARFQLEGPYARTVISKACALDLHPKAFPPGRCARTRFAGMPVVLHCREAATFEGIVASSYREYLLSWLTDAAVEFS
jgi:sarcosine oxidase subunit gamma